MQVIRLPGISWTRADDRYSLWNQVIHVYSDEGVSIPSISLAVRQWRTIWHSNCADIKQGMLYENPEHLLTSIGHWGQLIPSAELAARHPGLDSSNLCSHMFCSWFKSDKWPSNRQKRLQMPRQHCCRVICNIFLWLLIEFWMSKTKLFKWGQNQISTHIQLLIAYQGTKD